MLGDFREKIELSGSNANSATITITHDIEKVGAAIADFTAAYNDLSQSLSIEPNFAYTNLKSFFDNLISSHASELSEYGISKQDDMIVIDTEKFEDALKSNYYSLQDTFSKPGGIAQKTIFGLERLLFAPNLGISNFEMNKSVMVFSTENAIVDQLI